MVLRGEWVGCVVYGCEDKVEVPNSDGIEALHLEIYACPEHAESVSRLLGPPTHVIHDEVRH